MSSTSRSEGMPGSMRHPRTVIHAVFTAALIFGVAPLAAQGPVSMRVGIQSVQSGFHDERAPTFPMNEVGSGRRVLRYVLLGAAVGAAAGFYVGRHAERSPPIGSDGGPAAVPLAILGGVWGALLGHVASQQ